jgi:hypothetical protein
MGLTEVIGNANPEQHSDEEKTSRSFGTHPHLCVARSHVAPSQQSMSLWQPVPGELQQEFKVSWTFEQQ